MSIIPAKLGLGAGGALDETYEQALKAIGDQTLDLDRRAFGGPDYRDGEAFDRH